MQIFDKMEDLAKLAHKLRQQVEILLSGPKPPHSQSQSKSAQQLNGEYEYFIQKLYKIDKAPNHIIFADFYTQLLVYGCFTAWIKYKLQNNHQNLFKIRNIGQFLPLSKNIKYFFDNLKNQLETELRSVIEPIFTFFSENLQLDITDDPESIITLFYSDFLKYYDADTAKNRGVNYTPHEIVNYIVDGTDKLLEHYFNCINGVLGGSKDTVIHFLDPAAGNMAFGTGILQKAVEKFDTIDKSSLSPLYENITEWMKLAFFPHFFSYEVLFNPYILGQIRLLLSLEQLGVDLNLATLSTNFFFENSLKSAKEIEHTIKNSKNKHIQVILGNPPYNLSSQNDFPWINQKIDDYKRGLDERNLKILSDDYIKFIRYAQWKIEQMGMGIVGFITNNKYLDGQMFSIMRKSLRKSFDHIFVVNLHGDMRKGEQGNVFDIRVGVAIIFLIKTDSSDQSPARVYFQDIPQSSKEEKIQILRQGFNFSHFSEIQDTPKDYFVDFDTTYLQRFYSFPSIKSFFKVSPKSGIMAGKDHLVMDIDKKQLKAKLKLFFEEKFNVLEEQSIRINDTKSWQKQKVLRNTNYNKAINSISKIQYRGFDYRFIAHDKYLVEGHRSGYIDLIDEENPAITVSKSSRKKKYCTSFISQHLIEKCYLSVTDTSYAFLLNFQGRSNVKTSHFSFPATEKEIFSYIYGIIWARTYRQRYDELLRKNFPKIPLPMSKSVFSRMSELGKRLANIHCLNIIPDSQFNLISPESSWKITEIIYDEDSEKLFINDNTWISGISPKIWQFSIGEIQQLSQFLESRIYSEEQKFGFLNRGLNKEEVNYLLKMCTAIKMTLEMEEDLDRIYKRIDPLED